MAAIELFTTSLFNDAALQAYYRMEGNSNDAKNSNNGTDTSMSYSSTNAKFGQAADFNGSSSLISIPLSLTIATNVTLHCWVYIPNASCSGSFIKIGGSNGYLIGVGNAGSVDSAGNGLCVLYEGIRGINAVSSMGTGLHMVDLVINGSGFPTVYLDGSSVYNDSLGAPTAPTVSANLGYDNSTNHRFFNSGNLDDVALFSRALTASEINSLYTGVFPTSGASFLINFI